MNKYRVIQIVETNNQREAAQVGADWLFADKRYPYPVLFGDQIVEPAFPTDFIASTLSDRVVKRAIAGVIIYFISRSLKNWAKE